MDQFLRFSIDTRNRTDTAPFSLELCWQLLCSRNFHCWPQGPWRKRRVSWKCHPWVWADLVKLKLHIWIRMFLCNASTWDVASIWIPQSQAADYVFLQFTHPPLCANPGLVGKVQFLQRQDAGVMEWTYIVSRIGNWWALVKIILPIIDDLSNPFYRTGWSWYGVDHNQTSRNIWKWVWTSKKHLKEC